VGDNVWLAPSANVDLPRLTEHIHMEQEVASTTEDKITERMVSMYEQRIENLQQENDKIRNKSFTRQIQIDEMKDQVSIVVVAALMTEILLTFHGLIIG